MLPSGVADRRTTRNHKARGGTVKKLNPTKSGIESARLGLVAADPAHQVAYNRVLGEPGHTYPESPSPGFAVEGVLQQTVENVNELIDKVAALEAAPPAPFPFGAPS
jgi:hypothetical protein